jgi:hypothetical protein
MVEIMSKHVCKESNSTDRATVGGENVIFVRSEDIVYSLKKNYADCCKSVVIFYKLYEDYLAYIFFIPWTLYTVCTLSIAYLGYIKYSSTSKSSQNSLLSL